MVGLFNKNKGDPILVPVTVITGFLGSGKSTLLNHILSDKTHGQKFAVIENELGAVAIDNKIISKHVDEEIIEVTNGCICCSIRGDLVRSLNSLYKKVKKFDGILLETTGLADPAPIIQTFYQDQDVRKKFKLDGVVTVVDAKHILERLSERKSEGTVNEALEQIAFSDKILLNKIDLVKQPELLDKVESEIREINPTVSILRTTHSKVGNPKKELLQIGGFEIDRALGLDPDFLTKERRHRKDRRVTSVCCQVEGDMHQVKVERWLTELIGGTAGENDDDVQVHNHDDHEVHDHEEGETILYRYKGFLSVKGMDQKFLFQGVGMVFNGSFTDQCWQEGEKRVSQFVFIGKNLDRELLRTGFEECVVREELRFSVGTAVEANTGSWEPGTIIKTWDEGNAYRIRVDGTKEEVWAPVDNDHFVRLPE